MLMAIDEAKEAYAQGEVPVGAVLVLDGNVLARAHNLTNASDDPTAHAEILAIREAARKRGDWRLNGSTLYVTLEPCCMCVGAAVNARVSRIVFGAYDESAGCCGSVVDFADGWFGHTIEVIPEVYGEECAQLLESFFAEKRQS